MSTNNLVYQRRRRPTSLELSSIPWLQGLPDNEYTQAVQAISVAEVGVGETICREGRAATYWFGLIDGLLKMSKDTETGGSFTYTGVAPGGWFGEGTALKREAYRYNILALRSSVVAGLPLETFHQLLNQSIGFNRFIMNQLNERLGQFIMAREIDRMNDPEARVARSLAQLFHPVLSPNVGDMLRITQQELAYLVGLSRQRVNEALLLLQTQKLIKVEYGGVRILDMAALRLHMQSSTRRRRRGGLGGL